MKGPGDNDADRHTRMPLFERSILGTECADDILDPPSVTLREYGPANMARLAMGNPALERSLDLRNDPGHMLSHTEKSAYSGRTAIFPKT